MSETLGELIVRLGLDASTFQQGIGDIGRQIKTSNSEFLAYGKAAIAAGDNLEVLNTRAKSLTTSIELQTKKVEQYDSAADKNRQRLEQLAAAQEALTGKVDAAKSAYEESVKLKGKDAEETQALQAELERLNQEYADNEQMMQKAGKALDENTQRANYAKGALADMEAQLEGTNQKIAQMESALYQSGEKLQQWGERAQEVGQHWKAAGKTMEGIGKTLSATVTAPIVAMGTASIKASMDFETAFMKATKVMSLTAQETEEMRQAIIALSTDIPHTKEAISEVAQAAGQLGIAKQNVMDFSEVMLNMGVATNMSATEAADAMARFANITQMSQADFDRLGSTIVDLGNNFATTESEISDMAMRLAAAGTQIGLTEAEIMGFAASLSAVGMEAQAGGSALSKAMIQIQVAVETGGEKLEEFAQVAGMSAGQFATAFQEDAASAIAAFITGLGDTETAGKSTILMLEELGLSEVRLRDSLMRLAGNSELLTGALGIANNAWEENIALTNEAEKFNATAANQMQVLKNRISAMATEIGDDLTPKLLELANTAVDTVTEKWGAMTQEQKEGLVQTAAYAAAIGPLTYGLGKLVSGIGSGITAVGKFGSYLGDTAKALSGASDSTTLLAKGITALGSPLGVATIAIAALTTGLYLATKESREYNKALAEARDTTEELAALYDDVAVDMVESAKRIAEADQVILDSLADMSESALEGLDALKIGAEQVSADTVEAVLLQYEQLGLSMKEVIGDRTAEAVATYKEIFSQASTITEEEQQKILLAFQTQGIAQKSSIDDTFTTIRDIIERSMQESGEITATAMQEITMAIAQANADIAGIMAGDSGFAKTLEHQIKNGMIPTTQEGFAQITETAKTEYGRQLEAAAESYNAAMAYAEMLKDTDIEAYTAAADAAQATFDRRIADADFAYSEMLNIMYQCNKEEINALVERNNAIEENEKKLTQLQQEQKDARLYLNLAYAAELGEQINDLKAQNEKLKLTDEEVEQLSLFKVLYDQNLIYEGQLGEQMDGLVAKLEETTHLSGEEAQMMAQAILDGFETLPEGLEEIGQGSVLALIDALVANGGMAESEAEVLKMRIVTALDGLRSEVRDIGKEAVEEIASELAANCDLPPKEAEEIVRATAEPFDKLPGLLDGKTEEAAKAIVDQLKDYQLITKDTATELGELLDEGLVEGIYNKQQEVLDAATEVGEGALEAVGEAWDTHSPSKKGMELGEWFSEGIAEGIDNKQPDVVQAADDMARQALEQIQGYAQPFYEAGLSLGYGAADGLRASGPALVDAARSIAAQAAAAMREELDIHSPSGVAREIFRQVGEGAILGLRDEQELLARASRVFAQGALTGMTGAGSAAPAQASPVAGAVSLFEKMEVYIQTDDVKSAGEAGRIGRSIADAASRHMRLKGVLQR